LDDVTGIIRQTLFVGVHLNITAADGGKLFLDTKANGRPIAFIFQNKQMNAPGWAVPVETMKPIFKVPGYKRLEHLYHGQPSDFAFKFDLRRYK